MKEVALIYLVTLALAWPLGRYLSWLFGKRSVSGGIARVENGLLRLAGVNPNADMSWSDYARALLKLHLLLAIVIFLVLTLQQWLPLNPDHIPNMSWDLALHTVISFLTNTNQQHYSGQAQLSYFAHTLGIVTLQVVTPAAGLATLVAILRTLFSKAPSGETVSVGNFHRDLLRSVLWVMLPLSLIASLLLASQGVPSTYQGAAEVSTLQDGATQTVPLGPVAAMVAIKQLGTNGGGWFGPNSSVPLENPTFFSNMVETTALMLIPMALVFMLGFMAGRRRLGWCVAAVMLGLSLVSTSLNVFSERQPNAAVAAAGIMGPNMEGKEVRFGTDLTALWGSWTTQTSNGSVNGMHDSFNPLGGMSELMNMFLNVTFGGIGVGLIGYLLFMFVAAFIGSLMIGRAPSFLGRPLETREMKLASLALLLQPILILGLTAVTLAVPGWAGTSNPGPHGLSQVLYEYTSAFANNGSGFEGLGDDSVWWNLSCALALVGGRFIPMLAPLAIAASLASKRPSAQSRGTLNVDTPTFAVLTLGVIVLFALLSFLPALVLGPIVEALGA
ncbi:MAG: potassium-transporting ATPase subunit KdpA [Alcanivorax sp.]|nr:potassium-transporting ATPase subunit KdpA [Alcanivorax sp.]